MSLLEVSFYGAVFIIAVVMIRAITINSLPKKTFLVLWEMVLLRLLIPVTIPSVFSVYTLINHSISTPAFFEAETDNMVFAIPQEQFAIVQGMEQPLSNSPSISVWFVVWSVGMMLLAIFFVISYFCCLITPLTYGIFRPVILMPKKTDWENVNQLQYIFLHEYVHIYRFDTITKLVAAIHWFNPFVWVMYVFSTVILSWHVMKAL